MSFCQDENDIFSIEKDSENSKNFPYFILIPSSAKEGGGAVYDLPPQKDRL
jgi:hypothetical protein